MRVVSFSACALALAACGGSTTPSTSPDAGGSSSGEAGSSSGGEAGAAGERTLATCTTSIAADAPAIFKSYFKCVTIEVSGADVVVTSSALPPHKTSYYGQGSPNYAPFDTSRGPEYRANPNTLSERTFTLKIPKAPATRGITQITADMVDGQVGTSQLEYPMGTAGVALDSVALFNPMARPGDDIDQERFTFDDYSAHPAPDGTYHYHTTSKGPLEVLVAAGHATKSTPGAAEIELYGVMCDGTFVLGCTELDGSAPQGALDAQGGHRHDMKDKGGAVLEADRYHAHVCPTGGGRKYTPEIQYYATCAR